MFILSLSLPFEPYSILQNIFSFEIFVIAVQVGIFSDTAWENTVVLNSSWTSRVQIKSYAKVLKNVNSGLVTQRLIFFS